MSYPSYKVANVTTLTAASNVTLTPVNKNNKGFIILPTFFSQAPGSSDPATAEIRLYSHPTGGELGDTFTIFWSNNDSPMTPTHIPFRVHSITAITTTVTYVLELI